MPPVPKPSRNRQQHFLREWRMHRVKTQAEVASFLGSDQATVSRLERGITPYDQDVIERLAMLYDCDIGELLTINPAVDFSVDALLKTLGRMQREQAKQMAKSLIETIKAQGGSAGA